MVFSVAFGILGIVELNRIPNRKYSLHKNYWRIVIFSSMGCFYDIIMFVVLGQVIPPGEYGTGIEIMAVIIVLILYAPACIITSIRLKRRMQQFNDTKHNVTRMNALNCSIVFKVMFIMLETIWLVEVQ
jgi:hypothetical protein